MNLEVADLFRRTHPSPQAQSRSRPGAPATKVLRASHRHAAFLIAHIKSLAARQEDALEPHQ